MPENGDNILGWIQAGGGLLVFLLLGSLFVLTLALERAWRVTRVRNQLLDAGGLSERLLVASGRGDFEEARRVADQAVDPLRGVFLEGLERAVGKTRGDPARAMARGRKRAIAELRARVWVLGTAGALMPFVGLLGTVVGVMDAFTEIGASGEGGFAVVSAGISHALIATAAGLAVALEAVVFYNWLQNLVVDVSRELGLVVDELLDDLSVARSGEAPDVRAP